MNTMKENNDIKVGDVVCVALRFRGFNPFSWKVLRINNDFAEIYCFAIDQKCVYPLFALKVCK